ncbi:MAG: hypothetical protein ACOC9N_00195 [Gemmatimonadota bacterium]
MGGRWAPHLIAAGITIPFAIWVALSDMHGVLSPAAWLLPLAAAYYLGLRIGREVVRGVRRARDEDPSGRWMATGGVDEDDDEPPGPKSHREEP